MPIELHKRPQLDIGYDIQQEQDNSLGLLLADYIINTCIHQTRVLTDSLTLPKSPPPPVTDEAGNQRDNIRGP